jgi:hypothetical protein
VHRHDCSFIQLSQHDFALDIEAGSAAATERRVRCPLCGDRLVLSADGSVAKVNERL